MACEMHRMTSSAHFSFLSILFVFMIPSHSVVQDEIVAINSFTSNRWHFYNIYFNFVEKSRFQLFDCDKTHDKSSAPKNVRHTLEIISLNHFFQFLRRFDPIRLKNSINRLHANLLHFIAFKVLPSNWIIHRFFFSLQLWIWKIQNNCN